MTDGIASCAAAMEASQHRLDVAAENLSNLETDGFRRHVDDASLGKTGRALPLRPTGRALDLAVTGGSTLRFASRGEHGFDAHHTIVARAASLHRDENGHLVDAHGNALLGADGRPVVVPDNVEIRADGSFVKDHDVVGRVALSAGSELRSGFVEGSDVNPIAEMVVMLDTQRQYETASKALSSVDQARQKSANDVGKIQQ